MKKLLLILLLLYSCKFEKVEEYKQEAIIPIDTLSIEQIKIETH